MFQFRILFAVFVVIIISLSSNAQSPSLVYSTIIGGSGWDYGHGIAVDSTGCVYIAGQANSSNYPTTEGACDRTHNGGSDIFVSKLNQTGSALVYSTYT
ncbi:MAG: SBBP repeat-containing protein [Ignavibacteriaceae bacterium]